MKTPFKITNPKFDTQISQIDQTAYLKASIEEEQMGTGMTSRTLINGMPNLKVNTD